MSVQRPQLQDKLNTLLDILYLVHYKCPSIIIIIVIIIIIKT